MLSLKILIFCMFRKIELISFAKKIDIKIEISLIN